VLLLFGLALILNVNTSAAATITNGTVAPKVTSVNPVNNSIILNSQTIKVNFNQTIKRGTGSIILKNSNGTVISTKTSITNRTLSIIPTTALPTGFKYNLILNIGSIMDMYGHGTGYYSTCFTVSPITLSQMKDGINRVQIFYYNNGRLPSYVSYNLSNGTTNIPIAKFQTIIATQGLKIITKPVIDTSSVSALAASLKAGSTSQYDTAVKIFNWVRDNISYSFYYNTKYGAAGTLKNRIGNCCDHSNLLVALARDAGITARYVSGTCRFTSGSWYGHVWAQFYINGKWVNADATSSRNSLGVINNWNTATYTLKGIYNTLPF
jgi:Transglutaminase-like superfamily/Bacterial Ig-like domain/Pseudomurein-binding repeat